MTIFSLNLRKFVTLRFLVSFSVILWVFYLYHFHATIHQLYLDLNNGQLRTDSIYHEGAGGQAPHPGTDRVCTEQRHLYFLKTHKTGSTTVRNIIQRFALKRNLTTPVFLKQHIYPSSHMVKYLRSIPYLYKLHLQTLASSTNHSQIYRKVIPQAEVDMTDEIKLRDNPCHIIDVHSIFNKSEILKILPRDACFIATVRHPMMQLRSAASHFRLLDMFGIYNRSLTESLKTFLSHPAKFDKALPASAYSVITSLEGVTLSFTKNYIAYEYGFNLTQSHDAEYIDSHLRLLNQTFEAVVIVERFAESLILLRHRLCWDFQDILFVPLRQSRRKEMAVEHFYNDHEVEAHREWTPLDYQIYDMFLERHLAMVAQRGEEFQQELETFQKILEKTTTFCKQVCQCRNTSQIKQFGRSAITIEASTFNTGFMVEGSDCILMLFDENRFWVALRAYNYPQYCGREFLQFIQYFGIDGFYENFYDYLNFCKRNQYADYLKYNIPYEIFNGTRFFMGC